MTPLMPMLTVLAMSATAFLPAQPASSTSTDTCIAGVRQVSRSNFSSRNDRHDVEWRADGCDVTIRFEGDPRFSADFKTLEYLGARDRFDVDERNGRVSRAVEIRAGAGGLDYKYTVNGQQRQFDAEGRRWLDAVIREFFLRTAYLSKERVAYLFRNGGATRVLDEIDQMPTTYPQHAYMRALIDQAPPSAATVDRMLQRARVVGRPTTTSPAS